MKKLSFTKNRKVLGLLLWSLVLLGYFLFVFNWVSMNTMQGSLTKQNGWIYSFFGGSTEPSNTVKQAVNYSITVMRGIGAIGAGFVIAKLGHKKSVFISLMLLSLGLPTVFLGNIKGNTGYSLFIIGRMLMAIGGTVLIVYIQPIISRYFSAKEKTVLSRVNSLGFNLGAALPLIIICIPGAQNFLSTNWQVYAGIISGIPIILLIIYYLVAPDIDIKSAAPESNGSNINAKNSSWGSVLKDKQTWKFVVYFGAWIIFVVAPILILKKPFAALHLVNTGEKLPVWQLLLPVIAFILAFIPGFWLVGWISKTLIDRRYYIFLATIVSLVCLTLAYYCIAYTKSWIPPTFLMLVSGTLVWGIQGPSLNIPHEMKNQTPQRISILFGLIWGGGYIIYTIANIILSNVQDALKDSGASISTIAWTMYGIFAGFAMLLPLTALSLPKTRKLRLSIALLEKMHLHKKVTHKTFKENKLK